MGFFPVHLGHDPVQNDQPDDIFVLDELLNRFPPVLRLQYSISHVPQDRAGHFTQDRIVLGQQDRFGAAFQRRQFLRYGFRRCFSGSNEGDINAKRRSPGRF